MSSPVYNFELNLLFSILFFSPFHPNAICRGLFLILWEVLFPFSDFFEHFCFLFFRFLWAGADLFLAVALENLSIRIENIFLFEDTRAPNNIFISKCGDGKLNRVFLCLFFNKLDLQSASFESSWCVDYISFNTCPLTIFE